MNFLYSNILSTTSHQKSVLKRQISLQGVAESESARKMSLMSLLRARERGRIGAWLRLSFRPAFSPKKDESEINFESRFQFESNREGEGEWTLDRVKSACGGELSWDLRVLFKAVESTAAMWGSRRVGLVYWCQIRISKHTNHLQKTTRIVAKFRESQKPNLLKPPRTTLQSWEQDQSISENHWTKNSGVQTRSSSNQLVRENWEQRDVSQKTLKLIPTRTTAANSAGINKTPAVGGLK